MQPSLHKQKSYVIDLAQSQGMNCWPKVIFWDHFILLKVILVSLGSLKDHLDFQLKLPMERGGELA
jgi:hypothetical protein